MGKIKVSTIYIIIFTVAFITNSSFMGINFNYWIRYIIAAIWCFFIWFRMSQRPSQYKMAKVHKYLLLFMLPFIIMILALPIVYLIQGQALSFAVIARISSYFLQRFILIAAAVLTAAYFKKKAIIYTFKAVVISYSVFIIGAIAKFGIGEFFRFALSAWKEEWNTWQSSASIVSALEVHDLTFSIGFFVLYFFLFSQTKIREHYKEVIISFIFMWLGFKRIEIAAIIVTVLVMVLFVRKSNKSIRTKYLILTGAVLVVTLFFITVVGNSQIEDVAAKYNINFSGRLSGYRILSDYYTMSPFFVGHGYCYSTMLISNLENLNIIHSDILKSYIDYGFIGYCLWVSFYMYFAPKKIQKDDNQNRNHAAMIFAMFTLYSMINYLTDNVNVYFIYQICYILIPMAYIFDDTNTGKEIIR